MAATETEHEVRPARVRDLVRTAELHHRHLAEGFFARLGVGFLRPYHQVFVESPAAVVLVAPPRGEPQGVLVGTFDNVAHYRWAIRRRGAMLLIAGLIALARRPRLAAEFLRTRVRRYARALVRSLRPGRLRSGSGPAAPVPTVAVLTHVAVAPAARGDGTGRDLVEAFVRMARARGVEEVRLITPVDGPGPGFYRSLGWRRTARRRASDGTLVDEFARPL